MVIILVWSELVVVAKADSRLDLFIQKYHAMTDKSLPLAHPENPF